MARSPHLVAVADDLKLEIGVGASRRRFDLSDRAENLLCDRGYGPADLVPWVTAKALVLAGGTTLPEGNDEREGERSEASVRASGGAASRGTAWDLRGADGGANADAAEREALSEYLRSVTVPDRSVDALCEHVRTHDLPLDAGELTGRAERVGNLNDIARDL